MNEILVCRACYRLHDESDDSVMLCDYCHACCWLLVRDVLHVLSYLHRLRAIRTSQQTIYDAACVE